MGVYDSRGTFLPHIPSWEHWRARHCCSFASFSRPQLRLPLDKEVSISPNRATAEEERKEGRMFRCFEVEVDGQTHPGMKLVDCGVFLVAIPFSSRLSRAWTMRIEKSLEKLMPWNTQTGIGIDNRV